MIHLLFRLISVDVLIEAEFDLVQLVYSDRVFQLTLNQVFILLVDLRVLQLVLFFRIKLLAMLLEELCL